jgi:succinate dehydrogenase/fumarate reductase flavoprotein subunit
MTNRTNVLVIGSGAAGLRTAIAVYKAGSEVVVVGKRLRKVADMELVQFHPTGMVYPEEWAGMLVTEAVRDEEKLQEGLKRLGEIKAAAGDVDVRPTSEGYGDLAHALDLRASLVSAEASLLGAIERRERRGAHNRSDHPKLDPNFRQNFVIARSDGETLSISGEPVDEVPHDLEEWARDDGEVDIAGRLLE